MSTDETVTDETTSTDETEQPQTEPQAEPEFPHQNAYVGVYPEPEWQSPPLNTEAEVARLVEVGVLPDPNPEEKSDDEADEEDASAESDETDETDQSGASEADDQTPPVVENPDGSTSTGPTQGKSDEGTFPSTFL